MSLKTRLKKWLFHFIMDGQEPIAFWNTKPCIHCQQRLPFSGVYCFACGKHQSRDTEAIQRVSPTLTLTDQIKVIQMPGERSASAYWRLQKTMQK